MLQPSPKAFLWLRRLRLLLPFVVVAFFLYWRIFFTPDALFVVLFVIFLSYGLAVEFIAKFLPFLALLASYDAFRGLVPYISKHIHYQPMIKFDSFVGHGTLPTVWLQRLLYHGTLHWYDFYFYGLYMMHFVTPILIAVLIWRTRPQQYWRFVWSLVALSYAAFVTYIIFPAAPPWMASQNGYIPHIEKLSTDIWWAMGVHNFPSLYDKFAPNPVAAVPSLHAAYPTMVTLFIWRLYGWKWGLVALFYAASVWVGVIYMGEHYLFDVCLGITYAVMAFVAVSLAMRRWRVRHRRPVLATPGLAAPVE
jgi:hypothetical protein